MRRQATPLGAASLLRTALAVSAIALPAGSLMAQDLTSDRPDFTESAVIVRRVQLETGYTFTRAGASDQHSFGEVLFRLGVARRIELRLGANSYVRERSGGQTVDGLEDFSLGAKLGLTREPGVAIIVTAGMPTGSAVLGGGHGVEPEILLAVERDLSERFSFGTNASIASVPEAASRTALLSGSAVVGYSADTRTGMFGEFYGTRVLNGISSARDHSVYVDGGMTYGVTENFQLDARIGARVGARLTPGSEWFVGIGAVRRWR
jgi:hypothetical protein